MKWTFHTLNNILCKFLWTTSQFQYCMILTLAGQSGRYKQDKGQLKNNTGEGNTRLVKIESIPQMPILKVNFEVDIKVDFTW